MSQNESKTDIAKVESVFTPVMDIQQAIDGFRKFEEVKEKLLIESDYAVIKGNRFTKKSGWNKLACFYGVSSKCVSSEKIHNPDGSYEWKVAMQAFKVLKDGTIIYGEERSAIVSSLEKEQSEGQKNSPRKSHDVFASAETRAIGRAMSSYFGTGEVSAEEMGADSHEPEYCPCAMSETKVTPEKIDDTGLYGCANCGLPISEVRYKGLSKFLESQK